jgi:predicted CxxxxCH...CXXCH cytochrome family protein
MMKIYRFPVLVTICCVIALGACTSELKDADDLPLDPTLPGIHVEGWASALNANFHGKALATANYDYTKCRACHGLDLRGGTSKISCADPACHASVPGDHPVGWLSAINDDFHGKVLMQASYDFGKCSSCHGTDLDGGATGISCNNDGCHTKADGGPKACYTCHGDRDMKTTYPPLSSFHVSHVTGTSISTALDCADCHHTTMNGYDDPNHLGGSNPNGAEVLLMGTLANVSTKGTVGTPGYDAGSKSCSNVYCHGNFTNGNNATVVKDGQDQAKCGSCHGDPATGNPLPKPPHMAQDACSNCHSGVVDAEKNIIDKTLHMNGILNVFGQERDDW